MGLEKENKDLKLELLHLRMELSEIKERYDSLCIKLKHNANDTRNDNNV